MKQKYCHIVFHIPVEEKYIYIVPDKLSEYELVGSRVLVKFGRQQNKIGVVYDTFVSDKPPMENVLPIKKVIDSTPFYSELHFDLSKKLAERYLVSFGECLNQIFPIETECQITQSVLFKEKSVEIKSDINQMSDCYH